MLARNGVNVCNAFRAPPAVHHHMTDDRIAYESEFSGTCCGGECDRRTIEIRSGVAATLALVAVMACGPTPMRHCQVGDPVGNYPPAKLAFDRLFSQQGATREAHRREKLPIRH